MVLNMRVTMSMGRSTGLGHSNGQTIRNILVSSTTTTSTEKESTLGAMAGGMRVSGRTIRCTEREPLPGLTAESMLESI